ncbi:hypothetical protein HY745_06295, partial [Candidatus Desantisbacteria bacterium]|nr:hypothetical protein [Candidatus Desantisbacteria bacterium]
TRSPLILDYIDLLKGGFCKKIYFTVNDFSQNFKDEIEPKSPMFDLRIKTVNSLINEKIPVIPYFSPLLPWISNFDDIFSKLKNAQSIEFEGLNFRLKNINEIISKIGEADISIMEKYKKMSEDKIFYYKVWEEIRNQIELSAKKEGMDFNIYTHDFGSYFENIYTA